MDISIIIPAYNEEKLLGNALQNLTAIVAKLDLKCEIIVVDNNSKDRTAEIAKEHGCQVVFEEHNQISRARNAGANSAKGSMLIFQDADTIIPEAVIKQAIANLATGAICAGGALVSLDANMRGLAKFSIKAWNYYSQKRLMAAGCFLYCTKEAFIGSSGFNEKIYASEELWWCKKIKKWGRTKEQKFKIITVSPVITSSRKLQSPWLIILNMIIFLAFPFAMRFRKLCPLWYKFN